jgi:succinate dehydrogenase / fumarate reductase cytochrome b subunit
VIRQAPLSPHLQVWRWHITMLASILTRATGVALYGGLLIIALGALALASGSDAYNTFSGVMGSIPGRLILLGVTFSIFYHTAAGVRHLVWDTGKGFEPKTANFTAFLSIAIGLIGAIGVWLWAILMGAA